MENNNSVAYISKIDKIEPIAGADNIELASVKGWNSIVQKGIHKVNDLVLCITTDAVIPEDLATEWGVIRYLRKGNRVRTVKLKSVYSECILISLDKIRPKSYDGLVNPEMNMMEILNIYKYEPPEIVIQDNKGRKHRYHQNPNFHIYYKFPNFKNVPDIFEQSELVAISTKIHGTNARYGIVRKNYKYNLFDKIINSIRKLFGDKWVDYEYVYGSHNVEKGSDSQGFYSTDVWKEIADKYDIKKKLWNHVKRNYSPTFIGNGFTIYGEIYGPGIQGEKYNYGLKQKEIIFFDIERNENYESIYVFEECMKDLNLPYIKNDMEYWNYDFVFEKFVRNKFIENTSIPHEGIVVKCPYGDKTKRAKIINPDYLIYGEKYNVPDSH